MHHVITNASHLRHARRLRHPNQAPLPRCRRPGIALLAYGLDLTQSISHVIVLLVVAMVTSTSLMTSPVSAVSCPRRCQCPSAQEVTCKSAGMRDLPVRLGGAVTTLDFGHNAVSQLTVKALAPVQNLTTLKLNHNRVNRIKDNTFRHFSSLTTLDLSNNQIRHLNEHALAGLTSLDVLDLSANRIDSVEGAFGDLPSLTRLDIKENRLSVITQLTFSRLVNIRYLILSDNRITHIDRRAFEQLNRLMYLVLKGNTLGNIDNIVYDSQFLSYVDFSECALRYVPKGLPGSLRYLQLRRNNMTLIHREAFLPTPYLSILVLDENGITLVEEDAFGKLPYLQQLWMNDNNLSDIPSNIPSSLQRLLMDNNKVSSLTNKFPVNSQLDTLSLMGNNLSFIAPDAFSITKRLKTIDLSNNNIKSLYPGTFANLTHLDAINLSKNPIKYFYGSCMQGLVSLRTLSLSYVSGNATIHPRVFDDLPSIHKLDLDSSPGVSSVILDTPTLLHNLYTVEELNMQAMDVERLPSDFGDVFYNLEVVRITSTRWHCDQGILWFRDWIQSTSAVVESRDDLRCFTPHSLHGRLISSLNATELAPVVTTPAPLFKPIAALYFPPVPEVTTTTTVATPPATSRATTTRPDDVATRRRRRTTLPPPTTTAPLYVPPTYPDNHPYPDDDLINEMIGDRMPPLPPEQPPRNGGAGGNTLPPAGNRNGYVEIRTIPPGNRDHIHQLFSTASPSHADSSQSSHTSKISPTMLVIVAGGILAAIVVLAIAITIVVIGSRNCRRRRNAPGGAGKNHHQQNGGLPPEKTAIQYKHKDNVLYFTPATANEITSASSPGPTTATPTTNNTGSMRSLKSNKSAKNAKLNGTAKEKMALVSGRDVNHEGPLRCYKWEDF